MTTPIEDLVAPVLACVNYSYTFPTVLYPGFTSILMGCFGSLLAGINLILDFIPPDIDNLPDFTIPDLSVFIDAFLANAPNVPSFPSISISLPSFPAIPTIPLPAFDGYELPPMPEFPWRIPPQMPSFDPTAMCKMIMMFIALPFQIIQDILDSIFDLNLFIPDFDYLYDLLIGIGLDIGFTLPTMEIFSSCLVTGLLTMITELIG